MPSVGKIITGTAIGAGVIGLVVYIKRLKNTSDQLDAVVKANVQSLKLNGLTIRVDTLLKNPTGNALKIKSPYVKILFKDKVIGTSQLENKDLVIPKNGELPINGLMVNIPATSVLSLAGGLFSLVSKKQAVPLTVQAITTIDLGWMKKIYTKTQAITIKPKA